MRICQNCHKPDSTILDPQEKCFPDKCNPSKANDQDIDSHYVDCPKLIHDVRDYPRLVQVLTTAKPEPEPLSDKYLREGWKWIRNGNNVFRYKTLCRSCIGIEAQREENHRNYLRACAKTKQSDYSYNQILHKTGF
jgi:hypothetical protein